jgi:regulator of nucleoside diphosphate kinase
MTAKPVITVTTLDLERLQKVIDDAPEDLQEQADLLQEELLRANVVKPGQVPADVVTMNSRVRFRVQPGDIEREMTLVYPRDADAAANRISVLAPAGAAMLGLTTGDHIDWPTPSGGTVDVCILEVVYQPERAGDLHR